MNDKKLITKRMKELSDKINYHDDIYYKKNFQEISDEDCEAIVQETRLLFGPNNDSL